MEWQEIIVSLWLVTMMVIIVMSHCDGHYDELLWWDTTMVITMNHYDGRYDGSPSSFPPTSSSSSPTNAIIHIIIIITIDHRIEQRARYFSKYHEQKYKLLFITCFWNSVVNIYAVLH